jgi:hypothetical protein
MNMKALFSKKSTLQSEPKANATRTPDAKLDFEALDACVGGRADDEGVGCYARSIQSRAH